MAHRRQAERVDFDVVRGMTVRGYRLASIDLITQTTTSGDAYLVRPDGRQIDLAWRSERPEPSASWSPPTMPGSLGVITVGITEHVEADRDLGPVLEASVGLMGSILAAGIKSPALTPPLASPDNPGSKGSETGSGLSDMNCK